MNNIDWARKLSSRKFWAMLAGMALSIGLALGIEDSTTQHIVQVIGSVGSIVIYMLAEGISDAGHPDSTNITGEAN